MKKSKALVLILVSFGALGLITLNPEIATIIPTVKAQANGVKIVPPPPGTPPIVLSLLSPMNNTAYNMGGLDLNFSVSFDIGQLNDFSFQTDWQSEITHVCDQNETYP